LAARILAELEDIEITVERAVQGWERVKPSLKLRASANFYKIPNDLYSILWGHFIEDNG
jgi:hypothetical protein